MIDFSNERPDMHAQPLQCIKNHPKSGTTMSEKWSRKMHARPLQWIKNYPKSGTKMVENLYILDSFLHESPAACRFCMIEF